MIKILQKVQTELKAPKDQFNSFGGFKYRSAEGILEAVKPILANHGLTLTLSDEVVCVGDHNYIKATATVMKDGESLSVSAYAREPESKKGMDSAQITGAASSYARKYALNGLFLIDDTKDPDTDQYRLQGQNTPPETLSQEKVKALVSLVMKKKGLDRKQASQFIKDYTGKATSADLTPEDFVKVVQEVDHE